MNLADNSTHPLPIKPGHSGSNPSYSPDGKWLTYYDETASQIHIVELSTGEEVALENAASTPPAWTADGQVLYFDQIQQEETVTFDVLAQWNASTQQISRVYPGDEGQGIDEGPAVPSPDGQWLVVRRAEVFHPESRVFKVVSTLGGAAFIIRGDSPEVLGLAYWSPDSARLAFQVFRSGDSSATPVVRVWSVENQDMIEVARDAMMPQWLP